MLGYWATWLWHWFANGPRDSPDLKPTGWKLRTCNQCMKITYESRLLTPNHMDEMSVFPISRHAHISKHNDFPESQLDKQQTISHQNICDRWWCSTTLCFSQHKVPEFQDSAPPSCDFSRHANPVDYFMDLVTPEVSTSQVDLFVQKYRHWAKTDMFCLDMFRGSHVIPLGSGSKAFKPEEAGGRCETIINYPQIDLNRLF